MILAAVGLLVNYEKIGEAFLFFPAMEKFNFAFIPLAEKTDGNFFAQNKSWGWPFAYWQEGKFEIKPLIFDLIFYIAVWLFVLFVIWFIGGIKRLQERRLKPPKFNF
jgi:hypothetical protein